MSASTSRKRKSRAQHNVNQHCELVCASPDNRHEGGASSLAAIAENFKTTSGARATGKGGGKVYFYRGGAVDGIASNNSTRRIVQGLVPPSDQRGRFPIQFGVDLSLSPVLNLQPLDATEVFDFVRDDGGPECQRMRRSHEIGGTELRAALFPVESDFGVVLRGFLGLIEHRQVQRQAVEHGLVLLALGGSRCLHAVGQIGERHLRHDLLLKRSGARMRGQSRVFTAHQKDAGVGEGVAVGVGIEQVRQQRQNERS
jgi:hypothetical protein